MSAMDTMIITLIYSLPLAMIGVYYLMSNQLMPRIQKSRGNIMVMQLQPNGKFKKFYGKPIIENVTETVKKRVKNKETGEITEISEEVPVSGGYIERKGQKLQFFHTSDTLYDHMNTKMAMYDSEGNQVAINLARRIMPAVSPKLLDSLGTRIWNAGRADKFKQKKDLIFLVLISAGASSLGLILLFAILQMMETLPICVAGG